MAISTAAITLAAVTIPLAVLTITARPAGRLIRLLTRSLTGTAIIALAMIIAMLIRGDTDARAVLALGAASGTICAVATINARRLRHHLQQLRSGHPSDSIGTG